MFKELDPLLHSQLRLAIMSVLLSVKEADFVFLKEKTEATAGNLSVQLEKLQEAGYLSIEKTYKGKRPQTICRISNKGIGAFEEYVKVLHEYIAHKSVK
jgi:DNA-binding transcriptional ArsR family regulator